MARNAEAFMAHDQQGFTAYLDRVSQGYVRLTHPLPRTKLMKPQSRYCFWSQSYASRTAVQR